MAKNLQCPAVQTLKRNSTRGRGYSRKTTASSTKIPRPTPPARKTTTNTKKGMERSMRTKTTAPDCSSHPLNTDTASPPSSTTSFDAYAQVGRLMTSSSTTPSAKTAWIRGLRANHQRPLHEEEHREEEGEEEQHPQELMQRREEEQETQAMIWKIGTLHVHRTVDEAVGYTWRTDGGR
jgi:hypothetical protein